MTSHQNALPSNLAELGDLVELSNLVEPSDLVEQENLEDALPAKNSMEEFYALRQELLLTTLVVSSIVFVSVWWFYTLDVAISYLLGTTVGMVYIRMLARDVERLGPEGKLGKNRLALFVILIVVAARWNQLQVLPAFLGFLTFKMAIIIYTVRITFPR